MASKNIKGITIQIGGDASGLDKALDGVNKKAKSAQDELKGINKALKFDPGNVELLEQKQRALAAAVSATSEKLELLRDAQKQAADQLARGEIGQAQYDALTREIVATEAELKKATKEMDNFSAGAEKAKAGLNKVGSAAETVANKTKALSAAAGGALVAIGGLAINSAKSADELVSMSKNTGIATDDLQKMQYASELVDVSVENITGAMTKLKKSMASGDAGNEVFDKLGVSVRDAEGALRDSNDVFYEVLEALSQVTNETERDVLAMEVFGKSADQLAGIIDDGGESLRELGAEAESLGLILDTETLTSLNDVNDTLDKLKARAGAQLAKSGAEALEALTPVLETVVEKLGELFEWLGSLDEQQMQTIITVLAVIAAISPIAGLIAGIYGAITTFLTIWPQVKAVAVGIQAFMSANPIGLIATAVAILAGIIIANWDKIKPLLDAAWEKVKEVFDKIKEKIETAMETVKGVFEAVKETVVSVWTGITDAIKGKINDVLELINSLVDKINGVSDVINNSGLAKAIGVSIPKLQKVALLAEGGSLGSGTAIVGEQGPELLTMNNGRADVRPLATTTNTYNTYNQTSNRPVQIELVCDGETLARAMYKPMQDVSKQYGPSFVV